MPSNREIREQLLELFSDAKDRWFSTKQCKTLTEGDHTQVRTVLKKLHEEGKINCKGSSAFSWSMPSNGVVVQNPSVSSSKGEDVASDNKDDYVLLDTRVLHRRPANDTEKAFCYYNGNSASRTWVSKRNSQCYMVHGYGYRAVPRWMATSNGWPIVEMTPSSVSYNVSHLVAMSTAEVEEYENSEFASEKDSETAAKLKEEKEKLKDLYDALDGKFQKMEKDFEKLKEKNKDLQAQADGNKVITVVHHKDGKKTSTKIKDIVLPNGFDRIKSLAECRRNILLVGPAGCGKTYTGWLLSKVFKMEFASLSLTAGASEVHLLGRVNHNITSGKPTYREAEFLHFFENGGVFLLDELDAADPNMLLTINSGIANGYISIPDRHGKTKAYRHPDFVLIATANTFGRGANRMYAGRNQLDEATLDRFRIGMVEVYYDPRIEAAIAPSSEGNDFEVEETNEPNYAKTTAEALALRGYHLRGTCQFIRNRIEKASIRRIMSTRFIEDGHIMMTKANWSLQDVLEVYLEGWSREECAKLT